MSDLLFEIFSEEVPARMQTRAAMELSLRVTAALKEAQLSYSICTPYVTPRHLAVHVSDIPDSQPDITIEKKGPRTSAPAQAIDGFCQSVGHKKEELEVRGEGKDATYFAVIEQKGMPTKEALKTILEKILSEFPWPKSMRWGAYPESWVRPMTSLLCLFGKDVVPVKFGHLTAGNITCGHRFLAPEAITIAEAKEYEAKLEAAKVIVDAAKRKAKIREQLAALAKEAKATVREDEGLLEEVTGLVEWPVCLMGEFEAHYLSLPPEILILEMRHHQKYFALYGNDGKLANRFITVGNMVTDDGGKAIIHGNQRVIRARLEDGRFYWEQDRKKKLVSFNDGLKKMIFHAKLGTVEEKVQRLIRLVGEISPYAPGVDIGSLNKATLLCKSDLVSGVVGQFPELQGVMGRYYALEHKEDAAVADAIRDHYKPQGAEDELPSTLEGAVIALSDKLDSIVGLYSAGEKPTGSKDPFALRRAALGIIRIVLERGLRLSLRKVILAAAAGYKLDAKKSKELADEILLFFSDRLKVILKDKGVRHDLIEAVFDGGNEDDIVRLMARVEALAAFLSTEDGANLLAAYRRAVNIVLKEEKKDGVAYAGTVNAGNLQEPAEKALYEKLTQIQQPVENAVKNENYKEAMGHIAALRAPVDTFFDTVMVNAEDKALRETRLNLLGFIRKMLDKVANFNLISG